MKTRLSAILLNFPICICLYGLPIFAQTGVSLAGSITDEGNKPIAGALVTANRQTVPAASGRATPAADGTCRLAACRSVSTQCAPRFPAVALWTIASVGVATFRGGDGSATGCRPPVQAEKRGDFPSPPERSNKPLEGVIPPVRQPHIC
jgi:hypothetical protein